MGVAALNPSYLLSVVGLFAALLVQRRGHAEQKGRGVIKPA
jgi:hypothetical protein